MKRILILLIGILFLCGGALAEDAGHIETRFEDFALRTPAGLEYAGEKADGQVLFMYYPSREANVSMAAVNAIWYDRDNPPTPAQLTEFCRKSEDRIRIQYESGGYRLKSFEVGEPREITLWGLSSLCCDTRMLVGISNTDTSLCQRVICVSGDFGTYLFSISAWSDDLLEEAAGSLADAVQWN